MKIVEKISELRELIDKYRKEDKTIGFVPTMGYLHEGHLSLVRSSLQDNDITVMSIFVNPTQFGPNEDYDRYPRDLEGDSRKAEEAGVDILFTPSVNEMYPKGYNTYTEVFGLTDKLCGKSRPGHFRGVCTVVLKLFNIVEPDRAYFGQKDAQQVAVIKKMVADLNLRVNIITCPIVREKDGLAMSSRNVYLSPQERQSALVLSQALKEAEVAVKQGMRDSKAVRDKIFNKISEERLAEIDYVEVVDADTLEYKEKLEGRMLLAVAVRFGKTRLIDNVIVEVA